MNTKLELQKLTESTDADGALIFKSNGELIDSLNIQFDGNMAAMSGILTTMSEELTDDLGIGDLNQVSIKSNDGIFIVNKFSDDFIVAVFSKDITKVGFIMLSMNKLKIE